MRMRSIFRAIFKVLKSNNSVGESGQALVETALTVPVLVLMLLGAVELGQVTYGAIEVTNAAKAGVQYAAMNGGGFTDPNGLAEATRFDAFNLTGGTGTNLSSKATLSCTCSLSTDTVTSCSTTSPGITGCTNSHILATVTVNTWITYSPGFKYLFLGKTFTLHGTAAQRILQ